MKVQSKVQPNSLDFARTDEWHCDSWTEVYKTRLWSRGGHFKRQMILLFCISIWNWSYLLPYFTMLVYLPMYSCSCTTIALKCAHAQVLRPDVKSLIYVCRNHIEIVGIHSVEAGYKVWHKSAYMYQCIYYIQLQCHYIHSLYPCVSTFNSWQD